MLESSHILVVHRESAIRRLIAESLGRDGFRVSLAGSGKPCRCWSKIALPFS